MILLKPHRLTLVETEDRNQLASGHGREYNETLAVFLKNGSSFCTIMSILTGRK